jgi:hypothetical protein
MWYLHFKNISPNSFAIVDWLSLHSELISVYFITVVFQHHSCDGPVDNRRGNSKMAEEWMVSVWIVDGE